VSPTKTGTVAASSRPAPRDRILQAADRLFYSEGIHSVGVNRLVDESEVTRVTFYRHFPSKEDLIAGYLDDRARRARSRVNQVIADSGDAHDALLALGRVFTGETIGFEFRGCPFINASAEFSANEHPARVRATAQREWIAGTLERLLRDVGHEAPAKTARQLLMLQTGASYGSAIEHTADVEEIFLDAWDRLIGG
jgi:AcrR family transcriptional regulator